MLMWRSYTFIAMLHFSNCFFQETRVILIALAQQKSTYAICAIIIMRFKLFSAINILQLSVWLIECYSDYVNQQFSNSNIAYAINVVSVGLGSFR